jgi:hypothetical protein
MIVRVPKGKKLRIAENSVPITGAVPMVLEEDITLSLSSSFSPLLEGANSKLFTLLGSVARDVMGRGFSTQYKELGFQIWESTDPISFTCTVGFYIDKINVDGKSQVYDPMIALMKLPLPSEGGVAGSLIPPGPGILTLIGAGKGKKSQGKVLSCEIGNILRIDRIIVKKAEPTWSTDTDDNDYPIWGKCALDIQSLTTATAQMLDRRPE